MRYVEAFNKLGYQVPAPRTDWTAEKADGICLTLWKSAVTWTPPPPSMDLWNMHEPGENDWEALPGHSRRTGHLRRAWEELDGNIDVVLVSGTPGKGVENAEPWLPAHRDNHAWRLAKFDSATGFFSVIADRKE